MKQIPLTRGKFALVDDKDYEILSRHKWYASKNGRTYYATRAHPESGKITNITMHRVIMQNKKGYVVDHINGDGLDNQRDNLRCVSQRQNCQNRHTKKSSRYPGVYWKKSDSKWMAYISINGKTKYLGLFADEGDAFEAYKKAVKAQTGETVILPFKEGWNENQSKRVARIDRWRTN